MLARIVKIEKTKVTIQNETNQFYDVLKSELQFEYKLGDTIEMLINNGAYYFLPIDKNIIKTISIPQPQVQSAVQAQSHSTSNQSKIKGIGGWISFFRVTAALGILISISNLMRYPDFSTCRNAGGSYNLCNDIGYLLSFELIASIGLIIYQAIVIYLLGTNKKSAVNITRGLLIARIILNIIDIAAFESIMPTSLKNSLTDQVYISDAAPIITSIIWLLYFSCSERVRNTYTK